MKTITNQPPEIFCVVTLGIPGTNIAASADGVSDDWIPIQTAMNLCPSGEVVYLPGGHYFVTNKLEIKSGTRLVGESPLSTILRNFPKGAESVPVEFWTELGLSILALVAAVWFLVVILREVRKPI